MVKGVLRTKEGKNDKEDGLNKLKLKGMQPKLKLHPLIRKAGTQTILVPTAGGFQSACFQ